MGWTRPGLGPTRPSSPDAHIEPARAPLPSVRMPVTPHTDAVATFATTSSRQVVGCRVCGRTLLMGERSVGYFTMAGEGPFDVCQLCVGRAHRFGLRPRPSTAEEVASARSGGVAARMAATVRAIVGGRSTKATRRKRRTAPAPVQGSAAVAAAAAAADAGKGRRGRRAAAAAAPMDPFALGSVPVGSAAIPVALAAFNQSPHARTLAGLYRTLGAPRSSVAPRSATDREVILTVAWEIVWYQFRVMPDGIEQVRGQYLSELQPRWQHWNCIVAPDGTVRESGALATAAGQEDVSPVVEETVR
ncbi:MAG: hypothetical protein JWM98_2050 [Thermoleophilia bacterium]|nr:hypothetical protein [Thermoleophilia bacterium]